MKIIGYSERGLIYSLVSALNDENIKKFLCLGYPEWEDKAISDVVFYLEHSLSDFGTPDLLVSLKLDNKNTIIFIEAKVSNNNNWKLSEQYVRYENNDTNSNLFWQIKLKKLLIQNMMKDITDLSKIGVISDDERVNGKKESRKLGENVVVQRLYNDVIVKAQDILFLGIVPEKDGIKNLQLNSDYEDICFITWAEIEDFARNNNLVGLIANFDWNKGLIY